MPDSFNAGSMFYNNDLLQKAGASAPAAGWTIDDFHSTAEKIGKTRR